VKIRGDYRSPLMPTQFGGGFWNNLGDFFQLEASAEGIEAEGNWRLAGTRTLADLAIA